MDRYLDRISRRETYLLFLRKTNKLNDSWYLLESEPDGTLRQKRTFGDVQDEGLEKAMPFLLEWQKVIAQRISDTERELSKRSKNLRLLEYANIREKHLVIPRGVLSGQLLADVLEADLQENTAVKMA